MLGTSNSVFMMAYQYPAIPDWAVALLIIATAGYLIYKALIKKEEAFIKLITGVGAIAGIMSFVALNVIPAEFFQAIPYIGPALAWIFSIITYAITGWFVASILGFFVSVYQGEIAVPGI